MARLKSKQKIDSAQINAKAKAHRIQAVSYGLGGLATGTVAIVRFLRFDESGYDSKMNAAFEFMLIGFISISGPNISPPPIPSTEYFEFHKSDAMEMETS